MARHMLAPRCAKDGHGQMILDTLFAFGLLLTPASQLRVAGLPVGPGELCLIIWVTLILGREAARANLVLTPALSRLLLFWSLFTLAQSLGTLTAKLIGDEHDPVWFMHDVMAYPLLAAISCLTVIGPHPEARLRRITWLLCGLGTPVILAQLADAWGFYNLPSVDPMWWDQFRGWSSNPHQLAVLCMVLGFLSIHLAETSTTRGSRIGALACAIIPVYTGRITGSDSFTLIFVLAGPLLLAFKCRTWLFSRARQISFRSAFAWVVVLALPGIVISMAPLAYSIAVEAGDLAKSMARDNPEQTKEKTELRFALWSQAIKRGIQSGMLGLGPGPHLEIPTSIVSARKLDTVHPEFVEHPKPSFVPNFEAHNTMLDLFTQGGLLVVLSFVWLLVTAFRCAYATGEAGLPTLLCGLCIYAIATFLLRHPIFWFVIAVCLVAKPMPASQQRPIARGNALRGHARLANAWGRSLPRPRPAYGASQLGSRPS
ncbi:O-antigen ligase domain-containing protein [Bradyrhizobium sp. CCGUVB4N]|uniref:O-antigen ligase family protein n=1 Tax=Bradyrhizobium sp. CCGUVB4N TaxID=2949631 RepID=UPI0020B1AD96|nr:O-antigen ligase family protein [Bradyrhizobium sp. CCGUVB4N]MCP3382129.1 O-antigen ligase domain-containing protein [Bradyrhizobium sp. CCGUVB4N]